MRTAHSTARPSTATHERRTVMPYALTEIELIARHRIAERTRRYPRVATRRRP